MKECLICGVELPLPLLNSKGQFLKGGTNSRKYCSDECLDKKFSCNLCNKTWRSRRYYEKHIAKCQLKTCICGNTFYTTNHKLYCDIKCKQLKNRIKNIKCPHCDFNCKDNHGLKRHIGRIHKKLECKYCKKPYTKKEGGGRYYCSPKCSFDFWRKQPKNIINLKVQTMVNRGLKGNVKNSKILDGLSFTMEELRTHLENQFEDWMSWENHGLWHLDHIKPVASFNFTSMEDEDFKKCWALENLQPLKDTENMRKNHYYNKAREMEE